MIRLPRNQNDPGRLTLLGSSNIVTRQQLTQFRSHG